MKKSFCLLLVFTLFISFSVAAPSECDFNHPENSPLYFGNPSDAVASLACGDNYLLEKTQYVVSYNKDTLCPNWVGWHLSVSDIGDSGRSNKFVADPQLPDDFYKVTQKDYQFSMYGFDRGHVCPSADRTATIEDNKVTFLMTNMVPQAPDNNRIVWNALEAYERELAIAGNEVYIFAGPAGTGGIGQKGQFDYIPVSMEDGTMLKINVPEYTWKVFLVLPEGENDLKRVNAETVAFGVCVPNVQGCNAEGSWQQYICSINYIEELTGYDFFEILDDDIEELLESLND